jgi:hypothetical protein
MPLNAVTSATSTQDDATVGTTSHKRRDSSTRRVSIEEDSDGPVRRSRHNSVSTDSSPDTSTSDGTSSDSDNEILSSCRTNDDQESVREEKAEDRSNEHSPRKSVSPRHGMDTGGVTRLATVDLKLRPKGDTAENSTDSTSPRLRFRRRNDRIEGRAIILLVVTNSVGLFCC